MTIISFSRSIVPILILFLLSCSSKNQKNKNEVSDKLDEYFTSYVNAGDFSGNILIAKGDIILFQKNYGKANFELNVQNSDSIKFRIGSVTKSFTAAGICILKEKGQLNFNDPVSKFVKDFPKGDKITIDMLLRHTSGVPEMDYSQVEMKDLSLNELIAGIVNKPFLFEPGQGSEYSNEGYLLLAKIIENVSGLTYENFIEKNIFSPLGMTHSLNDDPSLIINNRAAGYVNGPGKLNLLNSPWYNTAFIKGAGSILSTANDLFTWCKAIDSNKLFSIFSLTYPYGWGKRNYYNHSLIEQSGMVSGFTSYIAVYPAEHLYITFCSNISSDFFNKIAKDIPAILFGEKYNLAKKRTAVALDTQELIKYEGKYIIDSMKVSFEIKLKKNNLYLNWLGSEENQYLMPIAGNKFYNKQDGGSILTFLPKKDSSNKILFGQEGDKQFTCTKLSNSK